MQKPSEYSQIVSPEPYIVQPTSVHTQTFILLHGLGSNGKKFGAEFLEFGISSNGARFTEIFPGAKFIFPTSKKRRSSAYRRAKINQWFDIVSLENPSERRDVQLQGLAESSQHIRSILNQELITIPSKNIILGGLSQGCAMALAVLLSLEFPLGGFVGMSGWLPFRNDIDEIIRSVATEFSNGDDDISPFEETDSGGNLDPSIMAINFARDILSMDELSPLTSINEQTSLVTPVLLCHGIEDEKIKCTLGEEADNTLSSLGMQITWKSYSGLGHWYKIPDEINDILEFLRQDQQRRLERQARDEACMQALIRHEAATKAMNAREAQERKQEKALRDQQAQHRQIKKERRDEADAQYRGAIEAKKRWDAEGNMLLMLRHNELVEQQGIARLKLLQQKQLLARQDDQRRREREVRDQACLRAHERYEAATTVKQGRLERRVLFLALRQGTATGKALSSKPLAV
ncbi:hypothetical protein B7463_g6283, partial [Scytalidium lignicola]